MGVPCAEMKFLATTSPSARNTHEVFSKPLRSSCLGRFARFRPAGFSRTPAATVRCPRHELLFVGQPGLAQGLQNPCPRTKRPTRGGVLCHGAAVGTTD